MQIEYSISSTLLKLLSETYHMGGIPFSNNQSFHSFKEPIMEQNSRVCIFLVFTINATTTLCEH